MSTAEEFWNLVYDFRGYVLMGFMFTGFLFVLAVFAILLSTPGSRSRALAYYNLGVILLLMAISGGMFRYAVKRHQEL